MKSKTKKILLGATTLGTVIAPIAAVVACDNSGSTTTEFVTSKDTDQVWDNYTVGELKAKLNKQSDAATASSNFVNQIKYELTEKLYKGEQEASFEYQKAFLRWNIFTAKKDQLALAKEIAALKKNDSTTSSQISFDPSASGKLIFIGSALGMTFTNGYKSSELFDYINKSLPKDTLNDKDKGATLNGKIDTFRTKYEDITKLETKLTDIDNLKDDNNSGWTSNSLSTDYPKLLKPISKITEDKTKTYNEAKAAFIDQYKTKGGGAEEWVKERASKYNNASTDAEAIKYLVNQEITGTAFGHFTYALNDTFTIEQALATYQDNGKTVHIFPWFENYDGASNGKTATIGDKTWDKTSNDKFKVWTNSIAEFSSQGDAIHIDTDNVIDPSDTITPLLSNKVFFLGRNTLKTDEIIVDLSSPAEQDNLKNAPISISHSLIKATQDKTNANLPWTIDKDALKNLYEYLGDPTKTNAKTGIELFTKLYTTGNNDDLYNQFASDDTGSRTNNGELGVQTYQWYARQGGMNDGFALATMVAYSNMQNNAATNPTHYDLSNSLGTPTEGEKILTDLKTKLDEIATNDRTLNLTGATTTADANTRIASWIDKFSDTDLKSKFGTIFTELFNSRKVVYELNKNQNDPVSTRYLLASPDSGVHIINIIQGGVNWYEKYQSDMKNVAEENNISKAKVSWSDLYKSHFTDDNIVKDLLTNTAYGDEFKNQITNLVSSTDDSDKKLIEEWTKAGYVKFETNDDDAAKGQKIIDAVLKSIEAGRINSKAQDSINAVTGRIGTYLIGQMDSKYIDPTIDPTVLYSSLLQSLVD